MSSIFGTVAETGRNFYGTLRQISASGVPGNYWNVTLGEWASSVPINDRKIAMTEAGLGSLGLYLGGTGALGTYTGIIAKLIHDADADDIVVGVGFEYALAGIEQRFAVASDLTSLPLATWAMIQSQGGVTSSNMRGTDSALLAAGYTAPDNANIAAAAASAATAASQSTTAATAASLAQISAQAVDTRLTTARATKLDNLDATVSSRSSHNAAAVVSAIESAGGVTSSNMRGTDNALLASGYTAPNNAGIATAAADATAAKTAAQTVESRVTATRAGYLDNLSGGAVATQAAVNAIQNTTRAKVVAATEAYLPDAGTETYVVELLLYDTAGNMEDPDSLPTLAAANQSGVDRSSKLGTVTYVSVGHYRATYTVSSTDAAERVIFTWYATESGSSIKATHLMNVVSVGAGGGTGSFTTDDRAKLVAVFDKLPSKSYLTGTAASDGDINLDELTGDRSTFKADVSSLATAAAVSGVPAAVQSYAAANGGLLSSNMRGTDNALLASGYTAPDNSGIATAATQATTAATQASTAASEAGAAKVAAQSVDSKLTVARAAKIDNLDAAISSRSTFDPATDGVDIDAGHGLATAAELAAVKAKTDLLPSQPAATGDIPTASQVAVQVNSTLSTAHGAGAWTGSGGDATEAKQDAILAAIAGVAPAPPSPVNVNKQRTWVLDADGEDSLAPGIVHQPAGSSVTLAMDFGRLLNPGTSIGSVGAVTEISGTPVTISNQLPSQDRRQAHFTVSALVSGAKYQFRVTVATSDGQTLSGRGYLIVE